MARKKAIIRSLPAVETLGSTTVICTDKTGTLTKNEMTVREMRTYRDVEVTGSGYDPEGSFLSAGKPIDPAEEDIALLLRIGVLCNNANVLLAEGRWEVMGDPTEGSLIVAARKAGALEMIRDGHVRISEHPFDSERKRMTTVVRPEAQDAFFVAMKGAPEVVLEQCSHIAGPTGSRPLDEGDRREILEAAAAMARRALRVLAFSWKTVGRDEPLDRDHVESDLIFAGLVGMMDPPRREAVEAIHTCKLAGIRPVMITGDHRLTARAISAELGIGGGEVVEGSELARMSDEELFKRIEEISVFARVTAEHKVRIVEALKKHGHIVTMTGDGVNDAPALKAADIGVAMGQTGTEVAKEASDMVITDDNFATIVGAVEEGRRIYDNIRKGTSYLLSVNLAEVMTIFLGVILGLPVPLLALQILWINVVAEEFPAMGLSVEPAHPDIMRRKPRNPREPILSRDILIYTLGISTSIFAGSLGLYVLTLQAGHELGYARTTAFAALGFFTLYNAYSSRSLHDSVLRMDPAGNKKLLLGIGAGAMAVLAAIYLPFMQSILGTLPLRIETWLMIAAASVVVVLAAEILKTLLPGLKQ
jgi:Ca2+-transporting ATPase